MRYLTNKEFKNLERNAEGRIVHLTDYVGRLTDVQIAELHEDDWQWYFEELEDLDYILTEDFTLDDEFRSIL